MIKLACNYYPEVVQLIEDRIIDIDYLKFPALSYQMRIFKDNDLSEYASFISGLKKIKPVLMHGLLPTTQKIGSKAYRRELDIPLARRVAELSGAEGISIHFDGVDTKLSNGENRAILIENIRYIQENFSDMRFISFENVQGNPFSEKDEYGICLDPFFISDVIHETGMYFLLDISHAYCSAKKLKMSLEAYMNGLPLDRLYEIHINGWIETESDIMAHTRLNDGSVEILTGLLERFRPRIVTLEYGRSYDRLGCGIPLMSPDTVSPAAKDEIADQIKVLKEIILRKG